MPLPVRNVVELARQCRQPSGLQGLGASFDRVYRVRSGQGAATLSPELCAKYGLEPDNVQEIVCVAHKIFGQQTFFNVQRTKKPITWKSEFASELDPYDDPATQCDFCRWKTFTAEDVFGRVENERAVTASNLFKVCQPGHAVVIFKRVHDPLAFRCADVLDLLSASHEWFSRALGHITGPSAGAEPLLLWNCLPRAGASQFHGHAQLLLTEDPFPISELFRRAQKAHLAEFDVGLWHDLMLAHGAVGLASSYAAAADHNDRVHLWPSLAPCKDMEIVLLGRSLLSEAFAAVLHVCLRTLVDDFQTPCFNIAICHVPVGLPLNASRASNILDAPMIARIVSRGRLTSTSSDFGALEVLAGASIGHTDPFQLECTLRARLASEPSCIQIAVQP